MTVLYSEIIGFSHFAEHLKPHEMIELVNSHIDVCTRVVSERGGEVKKLTGDGVLAYFADPTTDAALRSALALVNEMRRRRSRAGKSSPHRLLYGGVGLGNGLVYEGNVGSATKRDFTILGNTVNQVSHLESLTRDLGVRLTLSPSVVRLAKQSWPFISLGRQELKGQSRALEVFTLGSLPRLKADELHRKIKAYVRQL